MNKYRPVLYAIAAVLLGMLYVRACWEPSIRADERRRAGDRSDDSALVALRVAYKASVARLEQQRDSTGRVILELKRRAALQRPSVVTASGDTPPAVVSAPRDTVHIIRTVEHELIAAYEAGRRQDSLQLLFWKAQVAARDSIVPRLQQARDAWRKQASKPRHTATDILGGAALGYALAENDEIAAGLGGALIVLPRVLDFLGIGF